MLLSKTYSCAGIAWTAIVGAGVFALSKYEATPGAVMPASGSALTQIVAPSKKMTLVMFIHPKCPCSVASIEELSQLMSTCSDRLDAIVEVFQSRGEPDDLSRSEIWRRAAGIPGVVVRSDVDAILARKCGARTSGQVMLYETGGKLLFVGGITASRGHVGNNDGLDTVIKLVNGEILSSSPRNGAPVFGCAIYSGANDGIVAPSTKGQ